MWKYEKSIFRLLWVKQEKKQGGKIVSLQIVFRRFFPAAAHLTFVSPFSWFLLRGCCCCCAVTICSPVVSLNMFFASDATRQRARTVDTDDDWVWKCEKMWKKVSSLFVFCVLNCRWSSEMIESRQCIINFDKYPALLAGLSLWFFGSYLVLALSLTLKHRAN